MGETVVVSGISIADFKSMLANLVEQAIEKKLSSISLQPVEQKMYLTRKETAALLGGVSFPTLNNWEKAGILVPFRLGSKVRYRLADIQGLINSQFKQAA